MKMMKQSLLAAALACIAGGAMAALPQAEADRLGKDLTPVGAEKEGNKAGTIPAWGGGLTKAPAGFDSKNGYADPLPNEAAQYSITAANMDKYKDVLAPGQMEMLKRYPSYKMNVYKSYRTAGYPQGEADTVKAEASKAELAGGGNGVTGIARTTVPFPLPKTGVEVIWNHLMRYRGGTIERYTAEFPVQTNGAFTPVTRTEKVAFAQGMANPEPNRLLYYMATLTGPSSVAGDALLVVDPLDQAEGIAPGLDLQPGPAPRAARAERGV